MQTLIAFMTRCSHNLLRLGLACFLVGVCAAPFGHVGPCGPSDDAGLVMLLAVPAGLTVAFLGGLLRLPMLLLCRHA